MLTPNKLRQVATSADLDTYEVRSAMLSASTLWSDAEANLGLAVGTINQMLRDGMAQDSLAQQAEPRAWGIWCAALGEWRMSESGVPWVFYHLGAARGFLRSCLVDGVICEIGPAGEPIPNSE